MNENQLGKLESRINDLECQLAFQEQTIEELNQAITQQQLLICKMQDQMKYVVGKMKNLDSSTHTSDPTKEPPPPHY